MKEEEAALIATLSLMRNKEQENKKQSSGLTAPKSAVSSRLSKMSEKAAKRRGSTFNVEKSDKTWTSPSPGIHRRESRSAGSVELARRRTLSGQTVLDEAVMERLRSLVSSMAQNYEVNFPIYTCRQAAYSVKAIEGKASHMARMTKEEAIV
ncbi:hypothetical protein MRX96_039031 [Rhipicephalus microplus]